MTQPNGHSDRCNENEEIRFGDAGGRMDFLVAEVLGEDWHPDECRYSTDSAAAWRAFGLWWEADLGGIGTVELLKRPDESVLISATGADQSWESQGNGPTLPLAICRLILNLDICEEECDDKSHMIEVPRDVQGSIFSSGFVDKWEVPPDVQAAILIRLAKATVHHSGDTD